MWFEQHEGLPRQGDTSRGFDMGIFWNHCCLGLSHKELFAAALFESPKMAAAHAARLKGTAARAELPPAQKMHKMQLWFEQNDGIPPRRSRRHQPRLAATNGKMGH